MFKSNILKLVENKPIKTPIKQISTGTRTDNIPKKRKRKLKTKAIRTVLYISDSSDSE